MAEKTGVHARTQKLKPKCSNFCKQKPGYNSSGSSADRVLKLQKAAGNQAVQRLIKSGALQAKLKVGSQDDIYEHEADRVAEQVVASQFQRKCRACPEEKELIQRKTVSGTGGLSVDNSFIRDPGQGQPLDPAARAFFEPRFGHDFSQVRVHTGTKAAELAGAVNALAYTAGKNVVFGTGQYQPNTGAGRRLLAHELSHTIQQGAAPRQELEPDSIRKDLIRTRSIWAHIITRKDDPKAKRDDMQLKSTLNPSGKAHLYANQVASIYFATKSYVPDQDDHKVLRLLAQEYLYTAQRKGGLKGKVIGHADIELSSNPDNEELSFQRARWTAAAFKHQLVEAAAGTARVSQADLQFDVEGNGTGFCLGDPECKGKVNPEALAQYRRADVLIFTEKMPAPEISSCPPGSGAAVKTLGEYIELIRCAEVKTGYTPRQMLAMLRQMYYGKDWSATSQDPNWKFVIPCSPDLGNPKGKLGEKLFEALYNSDTVEGTDLGHVFTGLEAMTCPSSSVTLSRTKTFAGMSIGISLRVDLSNESFATWGGDLGAAAGAMTACWMMTNEERAKKTKDCHQGNSPKGLIYYFTELHAPSHDLEGDLAPFVMRAAEGKACGGSLETQFTPQAPISSIFKDFFYNIGPAGRTSKARYQCFAEAIGADIINGKITNRASLLRKYEEKVLSFAWAYYVNLKHEIPRSDPIVPMLLRHSRGALNLFFDWLQARMQE